MDFQQLRSMILSLEPRKDMVKTLVHYIMANGVSKEHEIAE
jgi:hypothetical protein